LDFVSLYVNGDFQPVSLYINIRSGSPSGAIIGTTDQVVFPGGMVGPTNFLFASPVSVTSGVTYYFEILGTASGGSWGVNRGAYGYAGGMVYFPGGFSSPNSDLWFQEGIIVPAPEPGTLGLGLVGVGVLAWMRRRWC
jgi:MYXO-CTERM domain-containing protein